MIDLYILKNREVVPAANMREWADCFGSRDRIVAVDHFIGNVTVSTIFLGVNHGLSKSRPLVFETMVFGGPLDQLQERCSTWEEAEAQHERVCAKVN